MVTEVNSALRQSRLFQRVSSDDRQRLAEATRLVSFTKGALIFAEQEAPDFLYTVVSGQVKIFKSTPAGKHIILEILGAGDPLGAVAVYEERPYPASAMAMEPTRALQLGRDALFSLLEGHPSLVRGLLAGLNYRLVELTNRMAELAGGRVEARLARLFLKLGEQMGRTEGSGVFIPLSLSRQDLADLVGATIETTIRTMSRWEKEGIVATRKDGFLIVHRGALEELAAG